MIGQCHCGAVSWTYAGAPEHLVACNCSICRRLGALWAHAPVADIQINAADDATIGYVWGDKELAFHSCKTCGCTTHWASLTPDAPDAYMAVNARLAEPEALEDLRVRRFDGAERWEFLD